MITKKLLITCCFLIIAASLFSQQQRPRNHREPVLTEVAALELVQSVYPEATKIDKINDLWLRITDSKNNLLGYAITSESFSNDIRGYNGPTPVLIITERNLVIKRIALLSHYETRGYVRLLENNGFFNGWANIKFEDAAKANPDGWTGATITADAVKKNISLMVERGLKNRPDRRSAGRR